MGDYTDPHLKIPVDSYEWHWTMGEIVTVTDGDHSIDQTVVITANGQASLGALRWVAAAAVAMVASSRVVPTIASSAVSVTSA